MRPCARLGDGSREAILDGTFKPRFWARQLLPSILLLNYPAKRTHRKAYRAHLEELRRQRSSPPSAPRS